MGKRKPKKGKKKRKIRTTLVFSDVHWNAIDDVLNFERLGELISRDSWSSGDILHKKEKWHFNFFFFLHFAFCILHFVKKISPKSNISPIWISRSESLSGVLPWNPQRDYRQWSDTTLQSLSFGLKFRATKFLQMYSFLPTSAILLKIVVMIYTMYETP